MKRPLIPRQLLPILLVIVLASGCKKTSSDQLPEITITSITPDEGQSGAAVTIEGSGFSENKAENIITFNGKNATLQFASSNRLIATVPDGAGTGPLVVQVLGRSTSGPSFKYLTITVSTLAGSGQSGFADGNSTSAKFNNPLTTALDASGNIYVADALNQRIRKINAQGDVSTFAGSGTVGLVNGLTTSARFAYPWGICTDPSGNFYVPERDNNCIRKISSDGSVTIFAGSTRGYADGPAGSAKFSFPSGVASDAQGNIYVTEKLNQRVRKITPSGDVSTIAGDGTPGYADGPANTAKFYNPSGICLDGQGNIYVADQYNQRIRKISSSGEVSTYAGSGIQGYVDGKSDTAKFNYPRGICSDSKGNIYVAEEENQVIRKITPSGVVTTVAGKGTLGYADGKGSEALFLNPTGVTADNLGNLYVVENLGQRIRKISIQ
jgi:sugar lactone lactonase YvrE